MCKYLFILLIYPATCFSETSLWTVSKNGNELYLGGTIHMLKKEDYPLPIEFNKAFKQADQLVLETNIEKANNPAFGQKVAQMLTYPRGRSLKEAINEKTFNKLKKYLANRNLPVEQFIGLKPAMVVLAITVMELKKIGMVDIGVDQYYSEKAKEQGKAMSYLETLEEQLGFLRLMGKGKENELISKTIDDMSRVEATMALIKSAWLKGDEKQLEQVALSEMIRDYPDLYQMLLVKRNNNWMSPIEQMMRDKKIELVLVGALHLIGKEGLLQQLRQKGYSVKKFK